MPEIKLEYDPEAKTLTYGLWRCPECGNEFYGGGEALHKKSCSQKGYSNCIYVIGPKVVEAVKEWAARHGDDQRHPINPISLADIKAQLPNVL